AFLLNLNRVAVLLGVYSNLPWIIAPYYAFVTLAGAKLTGHRPPAGFRSQIGALFDLSLYSGEFWHRLITILKPLLLPYAVGSLRVQRHRILQGNRDDLRRRRAERRRGRRSGAAAGGIRGRDRFAAEVQRHLYGDGHRSQRPGPPGRSLHVELQRSAVVRPPA